MTRYLKNKTDAAATFRGRVVPAGGSFMIPPQEYGSWGLDDSVVQALSNPSNFTMSADGSADYSSSAATNIAFLQSGQLLDASQNYAFAKKVHWDGRKLTMRLRGVKLSLDTSGTPQSAIFTVPYTECLLNATEVVGAKLGDRIKFEILDTEYGTVSGMSNWSLNTFGEDVYPSENLYAVSSSYDAALFQGLQIKVTVIPMDSTARDIYFNLHLHQLG